MKRFLAFLGVVVLLASAAALAQDPGPQDDGGDNGFLINFIQNQISAPGRRIRLNSVTGALSSQARIGEITVADDEGVWLRLQGVEIDWSRLALLRGRVSINRLAATEIDVLRRPVAPEPSLADRLPKVEAEPFSLPELPVSVQVADLSLPRVDLGAPVLGQAAAFSVTGAANLASGALDANLDVNRIDGPEGSLKLAATFSNATRQLALDLALHEAQGGVISTALDMEGRPAIDLTLAGSGPLDALDLNFAFDAAPARVAEGVIQLRAAADGQGFSADFHGGLAPVVPAAYRDFFAGETSVAVSGVSLAAGGLRLDRLAVKGAQLDLTGALATGPDNFPTAVTLAGRIGDPRGPAVVLPVPGASTRVNSAVLRVDYGQGRRWSGLVALDRLQAGEVEVEDLTLDLGGLAENLADPARRNVTIEAKGLATGVWSENPDLAAALGQRLALDAAVALPPGGPVRIDRLALSGAGLEVDAQGVVADLGFDGRASARFDDISPLSGVAARDLSGAAAVSFTGKLAAGGGFDLTLDGSASDLRVGVPQLNGLLAGETTLAGRVARDAAGLRTDGLRLANPQMELTSTGALSPGGVSDIAFDARINDLAAVDPRMSGALAASGKAAGSGGRIALTAAAEVPEGRLVGRDLTGARIAFDGALEGANVTGALSGGGDLGGAPITLAADIESTETLKALRDLAVGIGPNRLTGSVSRTGEEPILGQLELDAPDLSPLAALALAEATGSARATLRFAPAAKGQGVSVTANARDVAMADTRLGALDLALDVTDALAAPLAQGNLTATEARIGGVDVTRLTAAAEQTGPDAMQVSAQAQLANGAEAELAGGLRQLAEGFALTLDRLDLRQDQTSARLTAPATVTLAGETVTLTPLALDVAGGRLTAQGSAGETLDLSVALERLPLSIANAVRPDLGVAGTLDGSLQVGGARDAPNVRFDLRGAGLASAQTRAAGLPPAELTATGRTEADRVRLDATLAADGAQVRATGTAPLGQGPLALDVTLAALPLQTFDRLAGGQGLGGMIEGTAQVRGTTASPTVRFDLRGANLTARAAAEAGLSPVDLTASGDFARNVLTIASARAVNGQGLAVTASGRAPLQGPGLDIRASGEAPASLANAFLVDRAAQAAGDLRFDATVRGSLAQPAISGSATLANGSFIDPMSNLRLIDVGADVGFDGKVATLRRFSARSAQGGTISASGTVSLAAGNPADLSLELAGLRYTDGVFISTTVDGRLRARGPLTAPGGVISGRIDLGRTEISVAEGLGGNALEVLDMVRHRFTPAGVQQTLDRARVGEPRARPEPASPLAVDIRIEAPNQIFVRGRGLDVELGGGLTITGPVANVAPVGEFTLRRGRLEILGQRLDFNSGTLQLTGNLDPQINFVAETRTSDVTAIITVSGRVSSPEIRFSSIPALPQDEVLARVIFGRSVSQLSAFQVAQLAAAAAELAGGGGGGGLLDSLRGAIGFDDLDIITEEDGGTAVRAGRYIDDNIYLDVQTDSHGDSRAQINLEVSESLTLRGSVGTGGNSSVGVFYERDY